MQTAGIVLAALAALLAFVGLYAAWARIQRLRAILHEAHTRHARARAELEHAQAELAHVRRESELARNNVRTLVPTYTGAKPTDVTASFLRLAFRSWILWMNDCPVVVPFRQLLAAELEPETRVTMACELLARAIMESAFAAHLDGTNPRTDQAVLEQIAQSLGPEFATRVARDVALRGVSWASAPTESRQLSIVSASE